MAKVKPKAAARDKHEHKKKGKLKKVSHAGESYSKMSHVVVVLWRNVTADIWLFPRPNIYATVLAWEGCVCTFFINNVMTQVVVS